MKKKVFRKIISIVFVITLTLSSHSILSYAYPTQFGTCMNPDCCSAVPGTIVSGTSTFPYADSYKHQRRAKYAFDCDNCTYPVWYEWRVVNEYHEFVSGHCECGYVAYK